MHDKIYSGLRSYAVAKLLTQVVSWIGTILVVRTIDSEALGLFAITLVVFNYASLIFEGGFAEALVQRPPGHGLERNAVFTVLLLAGLALAAILIVAAPTVGRLLDEPAVAPYIAVSSISLVMMSFAVLPYAQLARQMEFGRLALIDSAQGLLTTAISVALAYAGYGAWALVAGAVSGTAIRAVSLNLIAPGAISTTLQLGSAIRYVRFGGWVFGDAVLWLAYTTMDTLLLGRWAGVSVLGFFRLGQELANMVLEKISTIVNQVALPAYAQLVSDRSAVAQLSLEAIRTHAVIGFPVFWGLAAVADLVLALFFGEKWLAAHLPLIAFAVVAPLRLVGSIESPAMTGTGHPSVLVKTKLVLAPVMIASFWFAISRWGADGAAWTWMTVFPVAYLISFHFVLATLGLSYRDVLPVVKGPVVAALSMVSVVACIRWCMLAVDWGALSSLAFAAGTGALVYTLMLRLLDISAFNLTFGRLQRVLGWRAAR